MPHRARQGFLICANDGRRPVLTRPGLARSLQWSGRSLCQAPCQLPTRGARAMQQTLRPDPTFHPSPRLAMEAEAEHIAYTVLLSPDRSRPDALAVIDVDPQSPTYGTMVNRLVMPHTGDEFHHFGWNACSSALS